MKDHELHLLRNTILLAKKIQQVDIKDIQPDPIKEKIESDLNQLVDRLSKLVDSVDCDTICYECRGIASSQPSPEEKLSWFNSINFLRDKETIDPRTLSLSRSTAFFVSLTLTAAFIYQAITKPLDGWNFILYPLGVIMCFAPAMFNRILNKTTGLTTIRK
jgi:hypothetical protein